MTTTLGWQTLSEMVAEVGTLVHDTTTARQTPIKSVINRAYDAMVGRFDWPQFLVVDETGLRVAGETSIKTFESGNAEAPLPFGLDGVSEFWLQYQDATDILPIVTPKELYERAGSGLNTPGRPRFASVVGSTAQTARLAADGLLTAKSDSASNDNVLMPRVLYIPASSSFRAVVTESLSGAYATGVSLGSSSLAGYTVQQVILPTSWKGNFTLEDGSGNMVCRIDAMVVPVSAGSSPARVVGNALLRLWPVPEKDYAMTLIYRRRPRPLVNDDDAPEIPVATYLVEKAAAEILRQMGKPELASTHEYEARDYMRAMMRRHAPRPAAAKPYRGSFLGASGVH
jgi:hypothetical protein